MKILFAAGGTAGHVNPALAVAGYIREKYPETEILFVGTKDRIESKLAPQAGFEFKTIDITGFQRKMNWENVKKNVGTVSKLLKASSEAKKIIEDFNPDVAVGFGGYVSGPVLRKAAQMKIPTAIHEQNAFPGVTNKTLAKVVDAVMLNSPEAKKRMEIKKKSYITGIPVRSSIINADRDISRAELKLDNRPLILSFGGSLGAKKINEAIIDLIVKRHEKADCYFLHATGQYGLWMPRILKEKGVNIPREEHIMIREYIDDMDRCLAAADLVICRAGASALSEIQALGKASILIPSPNVAENHQYHNAMEMVNKNAAVIIEEKDLEGEKLSEEVNKLLNNKNRMYQMGTNAKKMAILNSSEKISKIVMDLANA